MFNLNHDICSNKSMYSSIFSRHIAKIMRYLELEETSKAAKELIKKELWFLYEDIISKNK